MGTVQFFWKSKTSLRINIKFKKLNPKCPHYPPSSLGSPL